MQTGHYNRVRLPLLNSKVYQHNRCSKQCLSDASGTKGEYNLLHDDNELKTISWDRREETCKDVGERVSGRRRNEL